MKKILQFFLLLIISKASFSQQPLIARVSSVGTTAIYTDLKIAVSEALDDDFIYLPGGTFSGDSLSINKRIHIIGTGHYPDSTLITGVSVINMPVYFFQGCDGASIQGVKTNEIYTDQLDNTIISISKCFLNGIVSYSGSIVTNTTINVSESIIKGINAGNSVRFVVDKCIFTGNNVVDFANYHYAIYYMQNSIVKNSIFAYDGTLLNGLSSSVTNNIFYTSISPLITTFLDTLTTSFNNNLLTNASSFPSMNYFSMQGNVSDASLTSTFVNVPGNGFNYINDYHLMPASNGNTIAGGCGIYTSSSPYNPNPYNPHIYFKNIAPTTNAQGLLQIEVKVKAN